MTNQASPLSTPLAWDLVAPGYASQSLATFSEFSADALDLAHVTAADRILDIAAGPGSLSLQAAARAREVVALDFSSAMLAELHTRARERGIENLSVHEGDGQALPFESKSFDAAFSMFGLMFFPDRALGFAELFRVLKPGGRAVVSSWRPMSSVPLLWAVFEALGAEMPHIPFGDGKGPLSEPEDLRQEMSAAGFEVTTEERVQGAEWASIDLVWASLQLSVAPLVLLEHQIGKEAFEPIAAGILRRLRERFPGPVPFFMTAILAHGRRP